ncbi:hypothetical protein TELCIR_06540 [Teladorsagia circumcincta]|nr:hypothetical protein TELCIR_06540 [Teladorsagia circumcincta]
MASAGLHTPGCQTALVSLAPAYSGAITGFAFFFVACSGIVNPILTKWIARNGTVLEWNTVFYISTVIALLPLIVFNMWGSAEVQWWAKNQKISTVSQKSEPPQSAPDSVA